ncbi:MAG: ergothioneine biosynthesis protein EgtB [Aquabacterium sp.]
MTPPTSDRYRTIRARSRALCAPLTAEDHVPQPVEFVSPPKWHLAHTTWFFDALVLRDLGVDERAPPKAYDFLFNSYYETMGERVLRAHRGHLSRPTVEAILAYRDEVDDRMLRALQSGSLAPAVLERIELGLQHEQQHQELLLTDIKYILGHQPLRPVYALAQVAELAMADEHVRQSDDASSTAWHSHPGGLCDIGHDGSGFCFDNERQRHVHHLRPFQIALGLVSNRDYLAFMRDDGYRRFNFWHAQAWDWIQASHRQAPMYWFRHPEAPDGWCHYTLRGPEPIPLDAPVTHVSYFEAYAYAQWAGCRLPTEFEWEASAQALQTGARWEWTESAYKPYPGFARAPGAPGEYNGKFMVNQQVLRGGSYATPPGHIRRSYRNFFEPELGWQYTGIRLARDAP